MASCDSNGKAAAASANSHLSVRADVVDTVSALQQSRPRRVVIRYSLMANYTEKREMILFSVGNILLVPQSLNARPKEIRLLAERYKTMMAWHFFANEISNGLFCVFSRLKHHVISCLVCFCLQGINRLQIDTSVTVSAV